MPKYSCKFKNKQGIRCDAKLYSCGYCREHYLIEIKKIRSERFDK